MMKRIVSAEINEARDKDLKEYVEGARHMFTTLSNSVQNFREKKSIQTSQAEEFYNHAFAELSVFGMFNLILVF